MVRSLLVIGALMVAVVLMVPRVSSVGGPAVDVHETAVSVARESGWPIVEAVGLPAGWRGTSARFVRSTGSLKTWHAGYQSPGGRYAAVEQTMDATSEWVEAQTNRARRQGTREIAGRTWTVYVRDQKIQNSLVHRPEGKGQLATLVTGDASLEELAVVIEHLQPVTK